MNNGLGMIFLFLLLIFTLVFGVMGKTGGHFRLGQNNIGTQHYAKS